jgi:uncharacterized integral membrane protein
MRQLVLAISIAILAIIFAYQNNNLVAVRLIFWDVPSTNLSLVLVLTLIIGLIIGMLFLAPGIYRRNQTIASQKKRLSELEKEISAKKSF